MHLCQVILILPFDSSYFCVVVFAFVSALVSSCVLPSVYSNTCYFVRSRSRLREDTYLPEGSPMTNAGHSDSKVLANRIQLTLRGSV